MRNIYFQITWSLLLGHSSSACKVSRNVWNEGNCIFFNYYFYNDWFFKSVV